MIAQFIDYVRGRPAQGAPTHESSHEPSHASRGAARRGLGDTARHALAIGAWTGVALVCVLVGRRFDSPNLAIMAAVFVTSIMSSIVGFSFAAIGGAALALLSKDPLGVLHVMMLCGLANQAAMAWSMRRAFDGPALRPYLVGGALGLPVGIGLWLHAGRAIDTRGLGVVLIVFGLILPALRRWMPRPEGRWIVLATGFVGGLLGGAFEFPGAPVAVLCNLESRDRIRQRAIFQPFMLVMLLPVVLAATVLGGARFGITHVAPGDFFCVPVGLAGVAIGMALFRRMSDQQFSIAVSLQLLMSGLSYLLPR
jgi:uncharacterized membrane protein YfcA